MHCAVHSLAEPTSSAVSHACDVHDCGHAPGPSVMPGSQSSPGSSTPSPQSATATLLGVPLFDVSLFDVYQGKNLPEGKRSLAYKIVFGAMDRTLGTEEIDRLREGVAKIIAKKGWELRQ